jgi:predicted metal-dependent HD superfamily phosphohydrolase
MDYQKAKSFIIDKLSRELPEELTYHGLHHTLDVLNSVEELCQLEQVSEEDRILVKTADLFHDAGFLVGSHNHETYSCQIAGFYLPNFGYDAAAIEQVNQMIMATKIPQSPQDKLSQLLCDADLDYLGRDDFYSIGHSLFEELKTRSVVEEETTWKKIQVDFLEQHQFFTEANKKRRAPKKEDFLKELRAELIFLEKNQVE